MLARFRDRQTHHLGRGKVSRDVRTNMPTIMEAPVPVLNLNAITLGSPSISSGPLLPPTSLVLPAGITSPSNPPSQPTKGGKDVDVRPVISLDIERGNRMAIRWPQRATALTDFLTQKNETASADDLIGRIETLQDGTNKKLIPLFLKAAEKIHAILRTYQKATDGGKAIYKIVMSPAYREWHANAVKARGVLVDAGSLLAMDDEKVQTKHSFLKIPLYPWQAKAFEFINVITEDGKGTILADDTGLGKTITVAAHLASKGYKAVIACPKSLIHLWKRKVEMCSNLTVAICDADYPHNIDSYDVIIVSYSMLKRFAAWPLMEIVQSQGRVFVTDEGHLVRNPDAVRTSMSQMLASVARHTVVVTATPLVNRVDELHSILKMCRRLWTEASEKDFVEMYGSEDGQRDLAKELKKFMVRRLTHEVWKTAPKGEVGEAWIKLTNRTIYQEAEQDFIEWLRRSGADEERLNSAERGKAIVKLNYLRQLSAQGKLEDATSIIGKTLGHGEQVVVFSAYNSPIEHLAQQFANTTGVNYKGQQWRGAEMITGQVNDRNRLRIVDAFQAGQIGLLCIGVKAGGMGIDLPNACYAYFLDLPWTPADFTQCTGRLLRLGQERNCQFIKLLAKDTIDQRMEEIILDKAAIFSRTIDDSNFAERVSAMDHDRMHSTIVSRLIASYLQAA